MASKIVLSLGIRAPMLRGKIFTSCRYSSVLTCKTITSICNYGNLTNVNQHLAEATFFPMNLKNSGLARKEIKLPTLSPQTYALPAPIRNLPMIAYIDRLAVLEKIDPLVRNVEISENDTQQPIVRKEAAKMLRIRRKKMRKHKRKKWRKKYHYVVEKIKFRREKKKEQLFQAELLGQIKEAQVFDAEKYVHDILQKIRDRPKPETKEEKRERILDLKRKYRSNVSVIRPKFEDKD